MKHFPATGTLFDEIYQIKDFSRQNCGCCSVSTPIGRSFPKRREAPGQRFRRHLGEDLRKGRVLYNGLGHVQAVWEV